MISKILKTTVAPLAEEGIKTLSNGIISTVNRIIIKFAIVAILITLIFTGGCVATSYVTS